jgi:hypothetical protein
MCLGAALVPRFTRRLFPTASAGIGERKMRLSSRAGPSCRRTEASHEGGDGTARGPSA